MTQPKKLIEVAMPIKEISAEGVKQWELNFRRSHKVKKSMLCPVSWLRLTNP